ncbi:MAG: Integral rane protein [Actinomycetia bacterium]|nr:Integral rane protein [Actinomycetes bacterium]
MMPGVTASPARRPVSVAGWLVLAPLAGFAALRIVGLLDRLGRPFALESLTLWLLLPAWLVLAGATITRRRLMVGVAAVVVLCHLVWVGPDVRWWPREHRTGRGPTIRVVSANTYHGNPDPARAAARLASLHPDVLVVLELSPDMARALERITALDDLQYRMTDARGGATAFGALIWSRYPLTDQRQRDLVGYPLLTAEVALPSGPATVFAVHTLQPLAGLGILRQQLAELDYEAERTKGTLVLAGDFNATRQHHGFRALLQHGLLDAHLERGRGLATTWPTNKPGPPFALLDHVLVSKDVVVRDVDEATIPGSDHRAVVTQLRFSDR